MTDQSGGDEVGSVAEEAAKLFAALSDAARDRGAGLGDAASAAAAGVSGAFHDVNEHLAAGSGEDCRYCPLCQVIRLVRNTDPEVKAHLAVAASSLAQAAAGLLSTQVPTDKDPGVEKIDLEGDEEWD